MQMQFAVILLSIKPYLQLSLRHNFANIAAAARDWGAVMQVRLNKAKALSDAVNYITLVTGLNYFEISHVKNSHTPFCLSKDRKVINSWNV